MTRSRNGYGTGNVLITGSVHGKVLRVSPETLLVMTPTRGRPGRCRTLIESFGKHTVRDTTDMVCITDGDDDSYADMDWGNANHAVLNPRDSISGILNRTAD